jgi:transposase
MRYTFKTFQTEFPDDEACLNRLMEIRYGGTEITCPACGVEKAKYHPMSKRRGFACQECGHHIFPCAGTIFEKSSTRLTLWFFAMYLMTSTRHGVAAKELQRQLGVTYKTAWRMAHELRKLMGSADFGGPLGGEGKHVEIDETYFGGKQKRSEMKAKGSNKAVIFGMAERDGMLRVGPVPNNQRYTLQKAVRHNLKPGTVVTTDEWGGYTDLHLLGVKHETVKHGSKEYVRGIHHTNTIESHWGHFKRAVKGTHVSISAKHLAKYVAEFTYRRNFRNSHLNMFYRLISACGLPRPVEP